jgi:hypothetical protein
VGRRLDSSFDFCASVLGAISTDSAAAKEAARVAAAFYISSMAPNSSSVMESSTRKCGLWSTPSVVEMSAAHVVPALRDA